MDKRHKQIIGVVLLLFGITQLTTGLMKTPLIPSINVVTLLIGSPIVTICFILVGLMLIFEKHKDK